MFWLILFLIVFATLGYRRASMLGWTIALTAYFLLFTFFSYAAPLSKLLVWLVFLTIALPLNIHAFRVRFLTKPIFKLYCKLTPKMSRTEREALHAGTVGWEGELFTGMPNWKKLLALPMYKLSAEEQAFLDGPVEELCRMIDRWDVTHKHMDMTSETWQFIKDKGFFGMIIPKRYGGLEFSHSAHAAVISKLASYSVTPCTTVAVPNSLGPAELILEYGTQQQKDYYLPRLAKGIEIPCFALTNPTAGSDAAAIPDYGIVCRGQFEGKDIIGIRLNWDKRYITLAPVATLLGLAFKLHDPEHLLGTKDDLGITCALIPVNTPGVQIGRRHFPLNSGFMNGPTHGKDVFIPMEWIIGGQKMVGQGWRMLMECLAAGRAISLPGTVAGGAKAAAYVTGAYARIRRQFNLPIGHFEGVEEALAKIYGNTYMGEATRVFTVAALDRGEKPAVASAISKYHVTELSRKVVNDAMDVHGGKGICLGPRNYLGRGYQEIPIAITVEGANILTRSLIIFGQGAIRCHPYVFNEFEAAREVDFNRGLTKFDQAFWAHIGFTISNFFRAFVLGLTHGWVASVPSHPRSWYLKQMTRMSSAFAFLADVCMFLLGGSLKRREKLSARLGDVLSMLYIGSAIIKYFDEQGQPKEDLPLVDWTFRVILFNAQHAIHGILKNFPNRILGKILRIFVFPLGRNLTEPTDKLGHKVVRLFDTPTETRDRLAKGIYITPDQNNPIGIINETFKLVLGIEEIEKRLNKAVKAGDISGYTLEQKITAGIAKAIITEEEGRKLQLADVARKEVVAVDDFSPAELLRDE